MMKTRIMKKISLFVIGWMVVLTCTAQPGSSFSMERVIKTAPVPQRLVNDYASVLTDEQREALENKLTRLDDSTFTQITVVIVPSLDGLDVADAATELGRSWGIGNKKNNSGVILLISKKDRKLNISPGYGLEGSLTDVEASHIIQDVIVPNFKGEDYYRGIDEGTDAIIAAVKGTFNTAREKQSGGRGGNIIPFIVIVIIILLISSRGGGRGGSFMSSRGVGPFILGNILGNAGRGGGGFGGFGGGGGSSGGGGFGGFGGGSFGGGGSSGSW